MEYYVIAVLVFVIIIMLYILITQKQNAGPSIKYKKSNKKRFCPLCRTELNNEDDCVIGDYTNIDGRTKVYIYGCNYCLRGKKRGKRLYL